MALRLLTRQIVSRSFALPRMASLHTGQRSLEFSTTAQSKAESGSEHDMPQNDVASSIDLLSMSAASSQNYTEGAENTEDMLIRKLMPEADSQLKHLYVAKSQLTDTPTLRTEYNAIFRMYNWMNKVKYSNELFEDMRDEGHYPNRLSYKLLILANLKAEKHREVMELYQSSRRTLCICDVITYNAVLTSCSATGLIRDSMDIYHDMIAREVRPNIRTYAILFQSCASAHRPDLALKLNEDLKNAGLIHNDYSITPLISCLSSSNYHLDEAIKLYQEATEGNMSLFPNNITSIFSGLVRSNRTNELWTLKEKTAYPLFAYATFFQGLKGDQSARIIALWREFITKVSEKKASLLTLRLVTTNAFGALQLNLSFHNIPHALEILESAKGLFQQPGRVNLIDDKTMSGYFSIIIRKGTLEQVRKFWSICSDMRISFMDDEVTKFVARLKAANLDAEAESVLETHKVTRENRRKHRSAKKPAEIDPNAESADPNAKPDAAEQDIGS